ncbi:MAG: hypothetical protein ACLQU3_09445 [Limisphaerales bacterium]
MATPLGFILSLLGIILNKDRRAGILGLILICALVAFVVLTRL